MRLNTTGLGIGTSSPGYLLEVYDATNPRVSLNTGASGNSELRFSTPSSGYQGLITYSAASNFMAFYTSATERMRIDSSGNLLLGATSGSGKLNVTGGRTYLSTSAGDSYILNLRNPSYTNGCFLGSPGENMFAVSAADGTERARIDSSGNLLVGTTTAASLTNTNSHILGVSSSGAGLTIQHASGTSSGVIYAQFGYNATIIGSITQSGTTAVLYNTTSDQRLKTNIVDAPDGNIDQIKIRSFDWKSDGTHNTYGVIAQELLEVAPYAVHQPTDPDEMMGVDYSKLVPMMIKEIQSLKQRIATLESK